MNFLHGKGKKQLPFNLLPIVSNLEQEQVLFQPLKRFLLVSQRCFRTVAYCPTHGQSCTRLQDGSGLSTSAYRFSCEISGGSDYSYTNLRWEDSRVVSTCLSKSRKSNSAFFFFFRRCQKKSWMGIVLETHRLTVVGNIFHIFFDMFTFHL